MQEFSEFAEHAFGTCLAYLDSMDMLPCGGPMVCFHTMELEDLDVEAGWQVTCSVENKSEMECSFIPTRRVVTAIDQGPYEDQDPTLLELFDWIEKQHLKPLGPIWYCYLNDTERSENELLTQMVVPVT